MKKQTEIEKLMSQIGKRYNELTLSKNSFFDTYHDIMLSQYEGASEEANEYEYYIAHLDEKQGPKGISSSHCANECIKNIRQTLAYMEAVILLQKMTKVLPEPIYG